MGAKDLCTEDLCRIAVEQNGEALEWTPENSRSKKLCKIAVEQNWGALQDVPAEHQTEELCRKAIAQNGWALKFVLLPLRTYELCEAAVAQNGWALQFVPSHLRTPDLYRIAGPQDSQVLSSVPEHLKFEIEPARRLKERSPKIVTWDRSLLDRLEELLTMQGRPKERESRRTKGQLTRMADNPEADMPSLGSPRP